MKAGLILALSIAGLGATCDAYTKASGRVRSPEGAVVPETSIKLVTRAEREYPIGEDGAFSVSAVHGGKSVWLFSAPGRKPVEKTLRSGFFVCDVVLVPVETPRKVTSSVECTARQQ